MRKYIYFLLVIFLASCTSNTIYKEPKNLIPKDTMVNLLVDMYIASSARSYKSKSLKKDENYTYLVYKKYKIDSLRFQESNIYYTSKVESYDLLLKKVKDRLDKLKEKYTDSLKVYDSIKQIQEDEKIEKSFLESKKSDSLIIKKLKKTKSLKKIDEKLLLNK